MHPTVDWPVVQARQQELLAQAAQSRLARQTRPRSARRTSAFLAPRRRHRIRGHLPGWRAVGVETSPPAPAPMCST